MKVNIDGEIVDVDWTPPNTPPPKPLLPLYTARLRLQQQGKWTALVVYLFQNPALLMKVISSEHPGTIDASDPDAIAAIQAIGADPHTLDT